MKCPHCQNPIQQLEAEDVKIAVSHQPRWLGMAYVCPTCQCVLGVQMNPLTLQEDTVKQVVKKLGH